MRALKERRRGGQMLLAATFSLMFLFAAMGLSVDLGWAYFLKLRVQTAADAAATAAMVYAKNNGDTCGTVSCGVTYTCAGTYPPTTSLQAGCLYATSDGPPGFTATMIENNTAPPGVTGVAPSLWIKATVSTTAPNLFLFGSGFKTASIAAQAIAGLTTVPPTSCIYVLAPTGSGALSMTGSMSISTSSCAVYVDSNNSHALTMTGSGSITGTVDIVGCDHITGSATITPAPNCNQSSVADPFASLPAPTYSGCDHTNFSSTGSGTVALTPGVYCGGISLTGSQTVTMSAGTYILNGGGFSVTGSQTITGTNVFIYNTAQGAETIGAISMTGSGTLTMSAPTSGTYQGVLFFQDRSYSTAATVTGSSSSVVTGTLYFPDANLSYTGSATAQYTSLICNTLTITGSSSFKNDTSGTYTGLAMAKAALIQ